MPIGGPQAIMQTSHSYGYTVSQGLAMGAVSLSVEAICYMSTYAVSPSQREESRRHHETTNRPLSAECRQE